MFTKLQIVAYSAVVAMGFVSGAPSANAQAETVSVKVDYRDLDTTGAAGAKVLLQRIRRAAKQACGPEEGLSPEVWRYEYLPCVDQSTDTAVAGLNNPIVAALNGGVKTSGAIMMAKAR